MDNQLESLEVDTRGINLQRPRLDTQMRNVIIVVVVTAFLISAFLYASQRVYKSAEKLKVEALYIYPVKGLRGCSLKTGTIGRYGFRGDRTFCLQKVHRHPESKEVTRYETMFIGYNLKMALFSTFLDDRGQNLHPRDINVIVTWTGDDGGSSQQLSWAGLDYQVRFPMQPDPTGLEEIDVSLHGSPTPAYDMGDELATWFSGYLGVEVRLAFIGEYTRAVLGSLAPHSDSALKKSSLPSRLRGSLPFLRQPPERIVFNDLGQYLVVTRESNDEVTSRLSDNLEMDITKFRPNIVLAGSPGPFVEDFWAELTFCLTTNIKMALTANCYRCQSITVDYETGKPAADDRGMAWKKLNKDRRVDKGAKYSPVFGRYGFCVTSDVGRQICIGADVLVSRKNKDRTIFDWPGLTNFGRS